MAVGSQYFFNGEKFTEYIDESDFKRDLLDKINYSSNEDTDSFGDFYTQLINAKPKIEVDKLLFNHILYGKLKHTFVHKLTNINGVKEDVYNAHMEQLLKNYKTESITNVFHNYMTPNGFLLLDQLSISKPNVYFIAGLDRELENGTVRRIKLLIGKTYLFEDTVGNYKIRYMLAGIDINYNEGLCLVLIHNGTDVKKEDEDSAKVNTPPSFYKYISEKLFPFLNVNSNIDYKKDREGMYSFCKELLDKMFEEAREKIVEKLQKDIYIFGEITTVKLESIGSNKVSKQSFDNMLSTIEALLLGVYIRSNLEDSKQLKRKALELNLPGYPTRINYKNTSANKSSTGSSSAEKPLHESETLYSLYTDFDKSKRLEDWSMSWFTYPISKSTKPMDVIRTNITSTQKYFKVVFAPTRHLDERTIYYVIQELNTKRGY